MKIGFIKFGLKTYFNKTGTGQGSNHELVDVFNIFKSRGHECYVGSNNDIGSSFHGVSDLDYVFVFNGPLCKGFESKMNMFQGTCQSLSYLRDHKVKWVYFWTDPRKDYDIRNHEIYKINPPIAILSQEKEFYGHLEKLVLYNKSSEALIPQYKTTKFAVLMNFTDTKRSKKLLSDLVWVKDLNPQIRGHWKKEMHPFIKDPIAEDGVASYLDGVKYSYNINKNPKWISQKYYEMLLSDVICFYANYDEDNLLMLQGDYHRVIDGIDLSEKIKAVETDPAWYQELIMEQRYQLKPEYFNGDFIYQIITEKLR